MTEVVRLRCGFANCYLLRDGEAGILVDAGGPGSGPRIEKLLRQQDFLPEKLRLLLLTHAHPDHTGGAAYFRERYQTPVALHPADAQGTLPMTGEGFFGRMLLAVSRRAVDDATPPKPDVELAGGMLLRDYGIYATVLEVPGHTRGSVAVLLPNGALVAGDAFMNFIAPHTAHIAEDFAGMKQSAAALARHAVDMVYPGHGDAFSFSRWAEKALGH